MDFMKPYKILYLQATSEIGGSDVSLLRIVEGLDKSRFHPVVALPSDGPFVEKLRQQGCDVFIVDEMIKLTTRKGYSYWLRYLANYPKAVWKICGLIKRERIDVVHTNVLHNLYGFLAAKLAGVPHVWHAREIVVEPRFMRGLETWLARRCSTRIVVMSDAIAEMFAGADGGLPPHLVKLYDGVDLDLFHPRRRPGSRIRRELGIGKGVPLIGNVNRLDPRKGIGLFLEAAASILREMTQARFLVCGGEIAGHEGYERILRQKAEALGIADAVFFTGWRYRYRDIPEVYGALDVSVQCPVHPEAYGLANIEAMAAGVPVVAAAEGGPAELCADGETAILVPPGRPDAVAEAVLSLLRDPERRAVMGAAGRRRAEKLFDRRQGVKALEMLYEEILSGGPSRIAVAGSADGRGTAQNT